MKVNKVQAIIYMFSLLQKSKKITKDEILQMISLSDVSFRRYIQEIRAYLINFNEPYELVYLKKDDAYFLKEISILGVYQL